MAERYDTMTSSSDKELTFGEHKNNWKELLTTLKAEVIKWEKGDTGTPWDQSVRGTDKIKRDGNRLMLTRNNTTHHIATLKDTVGTKGREEAIVKSKKLTVRPGDSISKILTAEFGKGNFQYGDKGWATNKTDDLNKVFKGEELLLETNGQKNNDVFIYTLYRKKKGENEKITLVSSKKLVEGRDSTLKYFANNQEEWNIIFNDKNLQKKIAELLVNENQELTKEGSLEATGDINIWSFKHTNDTNMHTPDRYIVTNEKKLILEKNNP